MHLHRGSGTLAFRVPDNAKLRELLNETGPLIAPSANTENNPPAETIEEAQAYFGDSVDVYEDAGTLHGNPSTLIKIEHGRVIILRKGAVEINGDIIS